MKIDIAYYIRQVLREQRNVHVPEIGTFSLVQTPASFSNDKKTINPPSLAINFKEGNSEDNSLFQYIKDTELFSEGKIQSSISDFAQYIFNKLINVNHFELKDIGILSRKEGVDKVLFQPNLDSFTNEFDGLKSLELKPINRISTSDDVIHAVQTEQIPVRSLDESSPWWYPVLAGLIIAGLFILFLKGCQDNWLEGNDIKPEEQGMFINEDTEEVDSSLIKELDSKYKEVDALVNQSDLSKGNIDKEPIDPISSSDVDIEQSISKESVYDEPNKSSISQDDSGIAIPKDVDAVVENESVILGENDHLGNDNKNSEIIPSSGECIIILGSLNKARNISKLISLIEREGKKVYTSQYKDKTRVGFSFDCQNENLHEYLNDIRQRLSSKAWYLDPNLAVPYK